MVEFLLLQEKNLTKAAVMYRSAALDNEELMALYGAEEDCISEENNLDSEGSEEVRSNQGVRSSLLLEIHGLQREEQVYFTNQEYYRRLEELKSNHLRNMADLERMYISQGKDGRGGGDDGELQRWRDKEERQFVRKCSGSLLGSGPTRRLQRINSQEELDFHDTSSGSDQSEPCGEELSWTFSQDQMFERDILFSPEQTTAKKNFRFQSKPQGRVSHQTGARVRSNAKVTVPRPFQMMLREEERKRHRVRTRSEIELENTLLKRELEELKECQKKFRATPAPAHIHLPLYEIISRRPRGRTSGERFRERNQESDKQSPRPFQFLERERRKREAKIAAELGRFGQRDKWQVFKARAAPSSVYGNRHQQHQAVFIMEREATEGQSDQSSDPELDAQQSDSSPDLSRPQKPSSSKSVKKQIEVSIQMMKERK